MSEARRTARTVLLLSGVTLFALGGLGAWLIAAVQERGLAEVSGLGHPWWRSLAIGVVLGMITGTGALLLLRQPFLRPVAMRYAGLLGPLVPKRWHHVVLSLAAGIGEELLFRGALQHWLGVPLTALLFVALHGYLDPRDRRLILYGLYLVVCMLAYGTVARAWGLLPAMVAHTVFDLLLLDRLRAWHRSSAGE
ncbi:MAG TPA: CPBP family intramembrane metalloprotease [Flavobacteriales bacterium]|jgi:membrane protease YdiL (CAAX protease family)|nr:CPBP family intramembrane metalloprotease [Flavobacteriales bacterium]HQW86092.1 CPBP family intramembrane metalloprotease [Flavobacteriales bacterium]